MKSVSIFLFLSVVAWAPAATASAPGKTAAAAESSGKAEASHGRPVIHLGMTPDEVLKMIGHPDDTESIKTPAGEGERWTYKRLEKEYTDESAATVDTVPAFVGEAMPNQGMGDAQVPHYHLRHVKVYQVSTLLFVGGKLVAATQRPVKESQIEN